MDTYCIIFIVILITRVVGLDSEEPILYYYGLEESERGLPECGARQACAALLLRYWRPPALVRLCRCAHRRRCHSRAPPAHLLALNNRAHLQFCEPVSEWPECSTDESALSIETKYERMDPDEMEALHHQRQHLSPPSITLSCRCREPFYWRPRGGVGGGGEAGEGGEGRGVYECASLPPCRGGERCGEVDGALLALRQRCECPRAHSCAHIGGLPRAHLADLLYRGPAWRAYCLPLSDREDYDDY